jgi:HlyD family secretion protein
MNRAFLLSLSLLFGCARGNDDAVVATGTLEVIETDVAPISTARVARVLVNEGDSVRAGDTLAILTQPGSQAEIAGRQAQVQARQAGLREAENGARAAEIRRAEADLRAAQAEATRTSEDLQRIRPLAEKGTVPLQQRDASEAAARQAAARRDAARQSLLLLQQGSRPERITGARAEVASAEANLSAVRESLGDLTLIAPVRGVVLSRNAEPGEILTAGQSAITLGDLRRPWVRVYVNARVLPSIPVGSVARGVLDGMPARSFNGRVVAINSKAEFTPRVALTEDERADLMFAVKIEFEDSTGALKPGLPVTVTIPKKPSAK